MNYPIEAKAYPYYDGENVIDAAGYTLFTTIKVAPNVEVRSVVDRGATDSLKMAPPDYCVWFTELLWDPTPAFLPGSVRYRVQPLLQNVTRSEAIHTAELLADWMSWHDRPRSEDAGDWLVYLRRAARALGVGTWSKAITIDLDEYGDDVIRAWQHAHNVSEEPTQVQLADWALHAFLDRVKAELGVRI